ncbi:MAG: Swt1 family HEPN domain-containing protein [Actinomycetota bacterium]
MSSEDAVYVIAFQQKIDIGRHLDTGTVERIGRYAHRLNTSNGPAPGSKPAPKVKPSKQVVVKIAGIKVDAAPGMTAIHAREAKRMAERVYPVLYVFENSARDIISRVLAAAVGTDWWEQVVSKPIKEKVATRIADEDKEPWHSKRGAHPIYYTDLKDLAKIVSGTKAWPHFKKLFPSSTWFEGVIDDLNVSRRVVSHMNPLLEDDIKHVESGFTKWVKQIRAKASELP